MLLELHSMILRELCYINRITLYEWKYISIMELHYRMLMELHYINGITYYKWNCITFTNYITLTESRHINKII